MYDRDKNIGHVFGWSRMCKLHNKSESDVRLDEHEWKHEDLFPHDAHLQIPEFWDGIEAGFGVVANGFEEMLGWSDHASDHASEDDQSPSLKVENGSVQGDRPADEISSVVKSFSNRPNDILMEAPDLEFAMDTSKPENKDALNPKPSNIPPKGEEEAKLPFPINNLDPNTVEDNNVHTMFKRAVHTGYNFAVVSYVIILALWPVIYLTATYH